MTQIMQTPDDFTNRTGIETMSDGGLRVLRRHLVEARKRLHRATDRQAMHGVEEGMNDGDVDWHVGAASGHIDMALKQVNAELERRREE